MWDKINNAVPALDYSLRATAATGWKTNAQDEEGNEGRWVTMHGTPVFIKNGEDPKAAMSRTFAKDKPRGTERPRPKQPGAFKRWWREVVSDAKQASFRKRHPQQETQKTQPAGGEVPNAALRHFPRQVDMVFDGKLSSQQVVDGLMKSGMIRTGTASRELTRARYVKEFDKAVLLMEQQEAKRQSPGGGKNAYTDKGEKAKLRKGQSLAEKFFAPHIDQLADGMMSVTSKVDELARRGELGVMPGEPGFIKLRETVIKDFTKALNRRETLDRRYEKQRLKTDKPKKLTKREQWATWVPSEEELAASGPVVGTGWKRNMAENQPRDKRGRWTGVGWHGTRREFDAFDTKAAPASRTGAAADQPPFIYFTASPEKAVTYAVSKRSGNGRPRVIQADLRMDNPLDITKAVKRGRRKGLPFGEAKRIALSELTNAHDGFMYAGDTYNPPEYAVRDVSQIQVITQPKQNAFDPNQPRDADGKWTGGTLNFDNEPSRVGGFTKDVAVRRSTVMKGEERVITWHNPDGSLITDPKLVARAGQLNGTKATAPNYKGAWLNPDTESPLLAIAFDSKDRKHYVYSKEFEQGNAEAKFKIVEQMEKNLPVMRKQAAVDRKAGTPEAFLFKLEDMTCIRVGSDRDTGAEKKAYGLTTLRGEHVKVEGDLIKLEFPAKGGKSGSYTVKDRELATFITERKAANGDGPLWPDVTAGKFNAYLKGLDPTTDSPVTAHKFRHYHATRIAAEVVARYEGEELNHKAFTRVQKEACEKAAAHLSNTWTVTREKYVNPTVWGRLTVKAG